MEKIKKILNLGDSIVELLEGEDLQKLLHYIVVKHHNKIKASLSVTKNSKSAVVIVSGTVAETINEALEKNIDFVKVIEEEIKRIVRGS